MEKKKITIGIFALAAVAILSIGMVSAFGFGHQFMGNDLTDEEKAEMDAQREEMRDAIETEDYSTWKTLMQERIAEMESELTEENFNQLVEAHSEMKEARENGDFEGRGMRRNHKMRNGECPRLSE